MIEKEAVKMRVALLCVFFLLLVSVFCADAIIVNIPDINLDAAIRLALNIPQAPLTDDDLKNLTILIADGKGISDLTGLAYCVNLQTLSLKLNQISNISALAGLSNLTDLSLYSNQISDISPLAGLINLQSLDLYGNQINNISALAGLNNLQSLDLVNNQISNISSLAGLSNLRNLDLVLNQISDISALAGLSNLQVLYLDNNQISNISPLAGLSNLWYLTLGDNQISDISALAGLINLQSLYLGSNQISDISALAGLTNLQNLSLSSNQISNISALAGLINLHTLVLEINQISNLQSLLDNTGVGTGDFVTVTRNPLSYKSINTDIPALTNRGVNVTFDDRIPTAFTKISGDWQTDMSGSTLPLPFIVEVQDQNNVTFEGVPVTFRVTAGGGKLSNNDNVQTVQADVDGRASTFLTLGPNSGTNTVVVTAPSIASPITFNAIAHVIVNIPDINLDAAIRLALNIPLPQPLTDDDLKNLTSLDAGSRGITDLTGLEYCVNLQSLMLNFNQISDISDLAGLINLQGLVLSYNQISNISALAGLINLTDLSIHGNQISDISVLAGLINLQFLGLDSNQISDIRDLAGLINLTGLFLDSNQISDISALAGMGNLQNLGLDGNQISDISVLTGLSNLQNLLLNNNQIINISVLAGLSNLQILSLNSNQISEISVLAGLINLQNLSLDGNHISNLQPLVDNLHGLGTGDIVSVVGNPLSYKSINTDIPALKMRTVNINFDNRIPATLTEISGDGQTGVPGGNLLPFIVEVRDQHNVTFEGVPVTFRITTVGGHLSNNDNVQQMSTDANGQAETALTLGPNPGTNAVKVTAISITLPVIFGAIASEIVNIYDFYFNDGTNQGWVLDGVDVKSNANNDPGYGPLSSNFIFSWDDNVNHLNMPGSDPVNDNNGSIRMFTDSGNGIDVNKIESETGKIPEWWIMRFYSPDLSAFSAWQSAKGYTVKIAECMASTGDLYCNLYVKVYDVAQGRDRYFYNGTAVKLLHGIYNKDNIWNSLTFNWDNINNFPTEYIIRSVFVNIWGLVGSDISGGVYLDEVIPMSSPTYTLVTSVDPQGAGIVSLNPPGGTYDAGTVVTLTAPTIAGYRFVRWSGDASGTANPTTVTMYSNKNVVAQYIKTYTLVTSVNPQGGGTVTPGGTYDVGTVVTLTATATITPDRYRFVRWSGDASGTTSPITITMDSDKNVVAQFVKIYTLVVITDPSVGGSVSPDGGTYDAGTAVKLTAKSNSKYRFVRWRGNASGSINPITINMNSDKNITAQFVKTYTLIVIADPSVGGSVSPDGGTYDAETSVTITANPSIGYKFAGWSGNASGSTSPITITMDSNKSVIAQFTKITYTLVTGVTPQESGTVDPPGGTYDAGTVVTLTATAPPGTGYKFVEWSGDASGTTNPITITMDGNKNITAQFANVSYTLVTSVNPQGIGTVEPSGGTYDAGTVVTLTATAPPGTGYRFVRWRGDASGTANPITINMNSDKNVTAQFTNVSYTLVTSVEPQESGTVAPSGGTYDAETSVKLTAKSNSKYRFVRWRGDASGTANPITINMNSDKNITAQFDKITYTIVTSVNPQGIGIVEPSGGTYDAGTVAILTAPTIEGYRFVGWSGDASGTANLITINMNNDKNVTAQFAKITYTLVTSVDPQGIGIVEPSGGTYDTGTVVILTASTIEGYRFVGWSGDASGTANPITINMDSNKNVTAQFTKITYTLVTSVDPQGNGIVEPSGGTYDIGTVVTLTAPTIEGYRFVGWSGDASGTANPITINMDNDKNVTAQFAKITYTLAIIANPSEGGSVSPGGGTYDAGTSVTLTATPGVGYRFVGWSGDASGTTNPITINMDNDKNVTAQFAKITYTLITSVDPQGNGTVSLNPSGGTYDTGTSVTLTASTIEGYRFVEWSGDASGTTNPITVTMNGNKRVTAQFTMLLKVIQLIPDSENLDVPITTEKIQIKFSKPIDVNSIEGVKVIGENNRVVEGKPSLDESDKSIIFFTLNEPFKDEETVTVIVTKAIKDIDGNNLETEFQDKFTTGISVWPGDTNNDGAVNALDILPLGQYFTGNKQSSSKASWEGKPEWQIQPTVPWKPDKMATYADTNGDGKVNDDDLERIKTNWNYLHSVNGLAPISSKNKGSSQMISKSGTQSNLELLNIYEAMYDVLESAPFDTEGVQLLKNSLKKLMTNIKHQLIPYESKLLQNYPNPFNPETWIPFYLKDTGPVTIKIYNSSGQLVRNLELGNRDAGFYLSSSKAAYWDGKDESGEKVSSGVYFYTIKTGSFTSIKKMTITK